MWITLNCFECAREKLLVDVDLESKLTEDCVSLPRGLYACLDRHHVGLFALDWQLYLYINHKAVRATRVEGHSVRAAHRKIGDQSELILDLGSASYTMTYSPPPPVDTFTYSEVEEDVDFGLWLVNFLGSEERRRIAIENWTNHT